MLMSEKDDEKANDLKVEVVDAWENHVNLIKANADIKKIDMVCYIWFLFDIVWIDLYNCIIVRYKRIFDFILDCFS